MRGHSKWGGTRRLGGRAEQRAAGRQQRGRERGRRQKRVHSGVERGRRGRSLEQRGRGRRRRSGHRRGWRGQWPCAGRAGRAMGRPAWLGHPLQRLGGPQRCGHLLVGLWRPRPPPPPPPPPRPRPAPASAGGARPGVSGRLGLAPGRGATGGAALVRGPCGRWLCGGGGLLDVRGGPPAAAGAWGLAIGGCGRDGAWRGAAAGVLGLQAGALLLGGLPARALGAPPHRLRALGAAPQGGRRSGAGAGC